MQLSEAKLYRTRDGSRTGIRVKKNRFASEGAVYPWEAKLDRWRSFRDDGREWLARESEHDLFEEETPATAPPFSYAACPIHPDGRRRAITRDGREVVLLCDDAPGKFPIMGFLCGGTYGVISRQADGRIWKTIETSHDLLIPPPPKREVWVNLYDQDATSLYMAKVAWYFESQHLADEVAMPNRIGNRAYRIELEEP